MEITKEQDEHKVAHGNVNTKEDLMLLIMDQFKKDFNSKGI